MEGIRETTLQKSAHKTDSTSMGPHKQPSLEIVRDGQLQQSLTVSQTEGIPSPKEDPKTSQKNQKPGFIQAYHHLSALEGPLIVESYFGQKTSWYHSEEEGLSTTTGHICTLKVARTSQFRSLVLFQVVPIHTIQNLQHVRIDAIGNKHSSGNIDIC